MTYLRSSLLTKILHVEGKTTSNCCETGIEIQYFSCNNEAEEGQINDRKCSFVFGQLSCRGKEPKEKPQHGSTSKTVTRAQSLFSSASQSILNLTSKKLICRRPSPSVPAVQKRSKQLGSNLPRPTNAITRTTIATAKHLQSTESVLEKEKNDEPSVKKKIPLTASGSANSDKRKTKKLESKQCTNKKAFINDNSTTKGVRLPKKTSTNTCDKQTKSSVNSKKKDSKLCFSCSSHKKKNIKEQIVETKTASNNKVETSISEVQNFESEAKNECKAQKQHENLNVDLSSAIEVHCVSPVKHSSVDERSPQKRETKGRLCNPNVKSDSELYGDAHLKSVLKVLRSNLSPEAKLSAIKSSHDYWQKIQTGDIEWDQVDKLLKFSTSSVVDVKQQDNRKTENSETDPNLYYINDSIDFSIVKKQCAEVKSSSTNTSLHVNANLSGGMSDQSTLDISAEILVEPSVLPSSQSETDLCPRSGVQTVIIVDINDNHRTSRGTPPPKSPVTVQEWVNSIDLTTGDERVVVCPKIVSHGQSDIVTSPMCENPSDNDLHSPVNMQDGGAEDNLTLGAEAYNLEGVHHYVARRGNSDVSPTTLTLSPKANKITLGDLHCKQNSFNSETSGLSGLSSLSSVESLLEARKEDPEEILLALGFGGKQTYDPVSRIPQRFLSTPSNVRGVTVENFLQQQEDLMQRQDNSCLGYLGLSASPHLDGQPSSALANRILDKLEDSGKKQRKFSAGSSTSLQDIVSVMRAANAFRTGKMRHSSDSILDPANREFLEKQGKIDPLERAKKLILGMHTYSFDQEGGLVHSPESENEDSLLSSGPSRSKWKKMYKKLEDQATCVHEVDEENLKSIQDSIETKNKSWPSQQEESQSIEMKTERQSARCYKKRPIICRQLRIDDDSVFDEFNNGQTNSTNTQSTDGAKLKQSLKQNVPEIEDSKKKQNGNQLCMKDNQNKDSFELDELSPAEGLENETSNPMHSSWSEAEALAPCNFSDSSGFAEDVASESTGIIDCSKKHSGKMSLSKQTYFSPKQCESLVEKKTDEKRSDDSSDDCDETTLQDHSTDLCNKYPIQLQHSKKPSRLKRASSFVQGHNTTNFVTAISEQRRHSATTPGEIIFTQLKRGSSLWHLHPPLLWNNLSESSYMSSSEATLTSHQSSEKICEDISDSIPETKKSSSLFISTKNIWLSNEKNESKQCSKSESYNLEGKNNLCQTTEHQHTSEMEKDLHSSKTDNFTSSSLLLEDATCQPLHKSQMSHSRKYNFDKLLVDCLFSKLNSLKAELESCIRRHSTDAGNRNSNSRSLIQLRKGLLAQIASIENLLLHESQNSTMSESVVHAAQEMTESIFQQHTACHQLENASGEENAFQKQILGNNNELFLELEKEESAKTYPTD